MSDKFYYFTLKKKLNSRSFCSTIFNFKKQCSIYRLKGIVVLFCYRYDPTIYNP